MNEIGACGWPSMGSDTHVKNEFPLNDELFDIDKQPLRVDDATFAKPKAVPTATSDAAAASLQTAFCKKPSSAKAQEIVSFTGINDVKTETCEGKPEILPSRIMNVRNLFFT
uniref:Uncharacterized protein n=1 Tax=Angiostrongylus cantonensis TaxID=6313 RepID=A0A0K0CXT3_ANGCA